MKYHHKSWISPITIVMLILCLLCLLSKPVPKHLQVSYPNILRYLFCPKTESPFAPFSLHRDDDGSGDLSWQLYWLMRPGYTRDWSQITVVLVTLHVQWWHCSAGSWQGGPQLSWHWAWHGHHTLVSSLQSLTSQYKPMIQHTTNLNELVLRL